MRVKYHLAIFFSLLAILTYVVLLPIKNINATENEDAAKKTQALFDELFEDMTYSGSALNPNIDISKAILTLEKLIEQGANPNKKVSFNDGNYYEYLYTPISYIFYACGWDSTTYGADDRNFYLEIVKLLIDSGVDWNAKDIYDSDYNSGTTTIADRLKQTEKDPRHKPDCIEALNYVQNHLKENNITLEETKKIKQVITKKDAIIKKNQALFDKLLKEMTYYSNGLNHEIDIPKEILRLKKLIAQGANPNKKVSFEGRGGDGYIYTPISYIFHTCDSDSSTYGADDRNFYLEIIQLLIDSGIDWNAKNSSHSYYDDDDGPYESPITERFERVERNADKLHCIEALNYVKNHLKENNIILEDNKLPENLTPTPY